MRNNIWLKTIIHACHEILYYTPIVLLFNHFLIQLGLPVLFAVTLLSYVLGFTLGKIKLVRFLEWVVCITVAAIVSVAIVGVSVSGAVLTILTTIAVARGYRFRYVPWTMLFTGNAYTVSIAIYFITPMIFMFYPDLKIYSSQLYWAGLYCIIHALYTFNFRQLEEASQNKKTDQSIAMNVVRANRIGISVVVIVLFIIINLDRLTKLITAWIRQLFTWFSSWMSKPEPEPQDIPELPPDSQ